MAVAFPYDKQEDLIKAVERRLALYNKTDKDYTNRAVVQSLWNEISDQLECEALLCKAKWQSLRDYFMKKTRETKKCKRKGLPLGRQWSLYNRLLFILPFSSSKKSPDSPTSEKVELEGSEGEEISEPSQSRPFKSSPESVYSACGEPQDEDPTQSYISAQADEPSCQKKRKMDYESDELANSQCSTLRREPENDHELFFRSLIPTVSQLDEINKMCFRAEVQQLVAKYLKQQRGNIPIQCSSCNERLEYLKI